MAPTPDPMKAARKLLTWSHAGLAEEVAVIDAAIARFERGEITLPEFKLSQIRALYGSANLEFSDNRAGEATAR